ncbi:TfoX/Sxy family DNA transformation protein [Enterococcus faecalis]|uniref:TfoX/Sxy family DNA transformation protein n=1 Tax=Enterococcus faecalis TaxID=1351 RepID=A0A974S6G0_ENTFL|nr:TfoX/Sxy family DNA transformation protein [Enterococcus faecalis]
MSDLIKLPNIGVVLEKKLLLAGIENQEKAKNQGVKKLFRIRLQSDSDACLHMLYGLEGAIEGVNDICLSQETKEELKAYYNSLK